MTVHQLIDTLGDLGDTHELVLSRAAATADPLLAAWRIAAADARDAYAAWCLIPSAGSYAAYLAAEDQADAATETLCASRPGTPRGRCPAHGERLLAA